jgi:transposase
MVDTMASGKGRSRRVHGEQLKSMVLERCAQPGKSVAAIALEHGLNANLVHRWPRIAEGREPGRRAVAVSEQFVAVPVMAQSPVSVAEESIRIEIRRTGVVANVQWPLSHATQCAAWMRELMR